MHRPCQKRRLDGLKRRIRPRYLELGLKSSGDAAAALAFLRARFAAALLPALTTFLVGGPLIYSLPVVAGAALRNLGVLGMCVWLAVVAGG